MRGPSAAPTLSSNRPTNDVTNVSKSSRNGPTTWSNGTSRSSTAFHARRRAVGRCTSAADPAGVGRAKVAAAPRFARDGRVRAGRARAHRRELRKCTPKTRFAVKTQQQTDPPGRSSKACLRTRWPRDAGGRRGPWSRSISLLQYSLHRLSNTLRDVPRQLQPPRRRRRAQPVDPLAEVRLLPSHVVDASDGALGPLGDAQLLARVPRHLRHPLRRAPQPPPLDGDRAVGPFRRERRQDLGSPTSSIERGLTRMLRTMSGGRKGGGARARRRRAARGRRRCAGSARGSTPASPSPSPRTRARGAKVVGPQPAQSITTTYAGGDAAKTRLISASCMHTHHCARRAGSSPSAPA